MGRLGDFFRRKSSPEKEEEIKKVEAPSLGTTQKDIVASVKEWAFSNRLGIGGTQKMSDGTVTILIRVPLRRKRKNNK